MVFEIGSEVSDGHRSFLPISILNSLPDSDSYPDPDPDPDHDIIIYSINTI